MSEGPVGIDGVVEALLASYRGDPRGQRIGRRFLPSREEIIATARLFFEVFYPGYYGRQDLTADTLRYHLGTLLSTLRQKLAHQIEQCLCFTAESEGLPEDLPGCGEHAVKMADRLIAKIPSLRATLLVDVQAAVDGDPAASSLDEVILSYPGLMAVTVHRVAHELWEMGVPLMPRIMSEWAHAQSGADIHPGATIGPRFFTDHATGVVVGGPSHLGADVKMYQGVTLGALSHPRDENGRVIRNVKRHPTVEDGVTLYANATVLGGGTVIGEGSVLGGSVFVTRSVPPGSRVAMKPPELRVQPPGGGKSAPLLSASLPDNLPDFEI